LSAGSIGLRAMFVALGVLLAALFVAGVYVASVRTGASRASARRRTLWSAVGAVVWLGITMLAAARGLLRFGEFPPTALLPVIGVVAIGAGVGLSSLGRVLATGLPLWLLVGVQGFRLFLELMMSRACSEGLMPPQMSYSGYNFDILTGASALLVAALLATGRAGAGPVRLWNWIGLGLLINVVIIALLSTPTPLRVFMNEPANVWIAQPPYVWLPAVMVTSALLGHILVFRRLRLDARSPAPSVAGERTERHTLDV
jgi:hypothetical protein